MKRNLGMQDIEVILDDRPGALADLGQTLGAAGVSLEGGGVFTHQGVAIAHFLVSDAARGCEALANAGIGPAHVHDVVMLKLAQDVPGQLGLFTRRLAEAGINIFVQYSDHEHHLVLIVDPHRYSEAVLIASSWDAER